MLELRWEVLRCTWTPWSPKKFRNFRLMEAGRQGLGRSRNGWSSCYVKGVRSKKMMPNKSSWDVGKRWLKRWRNSILSIQTVRFCWLFHIWGDHASRSICFSIGLKSKTGTIFSNLTSHFGGLCDRSMKLAKGFLISWTTRVCSKQLQERPLRTFLKVL